MVELESLQHFDETEVEISIPPGNLSSCPSSPCNSSQHTLSSLGSDFGLNDVDYWMLPLTKNETEMERNVIASLDKVDIDKIRR
jgi:hypothetical protein